MATMVAALPREQGLGSPYSQRPPPLGRWDLEVCGRGQEGHSRCEEAGVPNTSYQDLPPWDPSLPSALGLAICFL